MKNKHIILILMSLLALAVACPLVSISVRTASAYRFACDIASDKVPAHLLAKRLGQPKAVYSGDCDIPEWIQTELARVALPEKHTVYLFTYEGLPYFRAAVVYTDTTAAPLLSIIWGIKGVRLDTGI